MKIASNDEKTNSDVEVATKAMISSLGENEVEKQVEQAVLACNSRVQRAVNNIQTVSTL